MAWSKQEAEPTSELETAAVPLPPEIRGRAKHKNPLKPACVRRVRPAVVCGCVSVTKQIVTTD